MHWKKLIAPIIIAVILALYFIAYILACILTPLPIGVKLLGLVILCALLGVTVFVLVERIKEVRSGVEDDLSKY